MRVKELYVLSNINILQTTVDEDFVPRNPSKNFSEYNLEHQQKTIRVQCFTDWKLSFDAFTEEKYMIIEKENRMRKKNDYRKKILIPLFFMKRW